MRNAFLTIALGFILCSFTDDPIKISVKDILASVQKERRVTVGTQTVDYLNKLNYQLPIVKDIGLKYGTDDLTNARRQYSASFSFNSFKMIKEQNALKTAQIGVYQAKKDQMLGQVMQERYTNMVDAYFSQNIIEKQRALENLLNQKNTVLKESLKKGIPIKVKDLVETEDDIRSLRTVSTEVISVHETSFQRIREYMGIQSTFTLNFENFITIAKLEEILNTIKNNKNLQTPDLKISQSQMSLSQAELRLEEASFRQFFDGIQLIYEHKNKSEFSTQDFSFRVGFNVPIKGNLRPKQNQILLDIKEAENDYQLAFFETDKQIRIQVLKIESLIKQYRFNQENLTNSISNNILNTPSVVATLSASDIVDLKIIQQKKEIELLKIQHEAMLEYVKLLDLTGDLTYSPTKNYLSNSLERW